MMDRSREARRAAGMVTSSNGLSRRRHRSNSLRDSPDEDGPVELQESVRLRERVKKDRDRDRDRERDRERDRDRDRERERERERERSSRSSKRRRGERIMIHGSTREDGGDDTSEESVNDEEEDEDEDNNHSNNNGHHNTGGSGGVRLLPPNPNAGSAAATSISNHYHSNNNNNHHHHSNSANHNHHHQQHLQQRKSFPPSTGAAKVFRAAPVWKSGDEMIGVSVPRKARSASLKRSHDWMANNTGGNSGVGVGGGGGEQIHRQASTSPVRQNIVPTSTASPAAPMSPSSSNASVRKKIKPNGPKQPRPPKSSSKASSSNPEELEIEIAEVLYGLKTQSQAPPKKEILSNDSAEANRSSSDTKSRVSSPISNSPSTNIQSSPAIQPPNSCSSAGPLSAIAPKRKRPRQVSENPSSYSVRSSPISSTAAKMEFDQTQKVETSSPNLEKAPGSEAENGYDLGNMVNSQGLPPELPPELMKADSELKPTAEARGESRDVIPKEELPSSPKKEPPPVKAEESNRDDAVTVTVLASSVTKASSAVPEVDSQSEKFQIDLEAPPPQLRSSPERETEISSKSEMDNKPVVSEDTKPVLGKDKDDEKVIKMGIEASVVVRGEEKRAKLTIEESESHKRVENKVRNIDLQLDLEKPERDTGLSNKLPQQGHKQQQQQQQLPSSKAAKEEAHGEKTGHSSSLPLPMSMASWPGGLPPMGYMAPIQGVVSMDGSTVSPAPIQPFFSQPRPKRCATHCYIARNIHYLQQIMKMNPFWPAAAAAAGSASLYGTKPLNVVPPPDIHGNIAGRAVNSAHEKAQGLAIFPGHGGKDKSSQPANNADASQRKQQILLQQSLPPVAPNNILHGPAFIIPLNQQPGASARPGSVKPPTTSGNLASTSASNSAAAAAASASATAGGVAAVSFNYPNMPANETQYLAILQNNGYPFPIPAAVGAPPNYRGTHPQPLPIFNGSFYSSQIIHPSQIQQPQQSVSQSQQMQQNHQNTSLSSGSSSSQKHLQSQQQRSAGSAIGGGGNGSGNMHNFPAPKSRHSHQQSQQPHNQQISPPQGRHLENEGGVEDCPSTADSRGARGPVNIYGQNFAVPIHPQNYALLASQAALANANATSGSGNQSEKKQQQHQQQGKNGLESLPPHTFAMSFAAAMNGATAPGIDLSSMAQNHAILQSLPEATRHNIQMMAATAAVQAAQRKNFRLSEDGKTGGVDSSNTEDERKGLSGKPSVTAGQSIAFSRSELTDASGSATAANNVIDSSARSLNLASGAAWTARSTIPNSLGAASISNAQLQHQHQPQQMMQLQKQQQLAASSAARNKTPATSNGTIYPEHLSSASSMAAKFPNSLSAFPQNLVQTSNSSSPAQSPQWKNSARANTSQAPPSFVTSTTSTLKSLPQQQGRSQQSHTQISFGANQKSAAPQGQPAPSSIQSPSSPMMVGSPSTSSISKGASGSPRTASASASSKTGQASSLSTQQAKSSSVPGQKSSPVGGRNVPSILGNPHITSTSNSGPKPQMQQQQQQLPKNMQQAQLFFSNPYMQPQTSHSTNTNAAAASGGFYIQRRRPDQQQQPQPQQPLGSSAASSTGMLTLSPVSLAGAVTSDPAKAIAAASNMKGGGLPSQSILHTAQFSAQSTGNHHQLLPAFSYVHPVPAAVQVKPAEQKQPAGNDNLHACWQPEKK